MLQSSVYNYRYFPVFMLLTILTFQLSYSHLMLLADLVKKNEIFGQFNPVI